MEFEGVRTAEPPDKGVIFTQPMLGHVLYVLNQKGELVNCGQVYRCNIPGGGETHGWINVATTGYRETFMVHPAKGVEVPKLQWEPVPA